jgi:hypothetical protein
MWKLVTLCGGEYPPILEEVEFTAGGTTTKSLTYGGYVLDLKFDHTDSDLRGLIASCMCYYPHDRPSLAEIEALMERKIKRNEKPSERAKDFVK